MADDTKAPGTVHDLEAQLRAMTARMDEMAAELDALRGGSAGGRRSPDDGDTRRPLPAPDTAGAGPHPPEPANAPDQRISRRGALALGAAAAVGISAVADSVLSPTPAGATTGAMQYGASNNAGSSVTDLTSSATPETLSLENTGSGSALTASGGFGEPSIYTASSGTYPALYALAGNAADAANAVVISTNGLGSALQAFVNNATNGQSSVFGGSAGTGAGVAGQSTSGYGLSGQGGLAPLFLTPSASPGAPSTGTHLLGELSVDSAGVVYSCRVAGTPGTWGPVLVGEATNQTGTPTYVVSPSNVVTLAAKNHGSGFALAGTDDGTGTGGGVIGQLVNPANASAAVEGLTAGVGPAVQGFSTSGYGVKAEGGMAPLYLVPSGSSGAPTAGAHLVGELYVDTNGVVFVCQVAGTPGTWVPVLVGGAINNTGATGTTVTSTVAQVALTVENTGTSSSGAALVGSDGGTGAGIGVRGECDNPANTSAAVEGVTNGTGPALAGACLGAGYGAVVSGGLAPLLLVPAPTAGPPTTGTHALGELYVDSAGVQYRCAAAGTPGTWVPQYSVVPLPAPVRVISTPTGLGGISGPLVPGATVHTSSVLAGTNGIPAGAVGIVANLAVSGVGGALLNGFGVMTIFPAGVATPATANINAGAGSFAESNAVTVAFGTGANAGKVSIVWNGGGAVPNAQAYLDVIAYIL